MEWLYRCSTILFFSARSMLNHQTIKIYSMKYIFNRFHINIWKQLNIHSVTLLFACKTIDKYWINILFWNFKHCNIVLICSNICSLMIIISIYFHFKYNTIFSRSLCDFAFDFYACKLYLQIQPFCSLNFFKFTFSNILLNVWLYL